VELIAKAIWSFFGFFFKRPKPKPHPNATALPGPNHPYVIEVKRYLPRSDSLVLSHFRHHTDSAVAAWLGWEIKDCGIKTHKLQIRFERDYTRGAIRAKVVGPISFETQADMILWKLKHITKD
jgi:hypothetical protein